MNHGKIFCVGLGPGDPDMMSVKADRLLRNARHVAYFRKRGHPGKARQLVNGLLHAARQHDLHVELVDLRNSGDTAGDRSRVVGYAAFAFAEGDDHG